MKDKLKKLESLLSDALNCVQTTSESDLRFRSSVENWSKKEVLGHLVDSSLYFLQAITEVQFCDKPYPVKNYSYADLVVANDYQNCEVTDTSMLLICLNTQISWILTRLPKNLFDYAVVIEGRESDLEYFIDDYLKKIGHNVQVLLNPVGNTT